MAPIGYCGVPTDLIGTLLALCENGLYTIVITCKRVMAEYAWGATPRHDILLHDTIQQVPGKWDKYRVNDSRIVKY